MNPSLVTQIVLITEGSQKKQSIKNQKKKGQIVLSWAPTMLKFVIAASGFSPAFLFLACFSSPHPLAHHQPILSLDSFTAPSPFSAILPLHHCFITTAITFPLWTQKNNILPTFWYLYEIYHPFNNTWKGRKIFIKK